MEVWIQRSLFEDSGHGAPARITLSPRANSSGRRRVGRVDRSRVTRDPAVATSHAQSAEVASDFRLGLARAFAELSPEQRDAIRASLNRDHSRSAA